MLWFLFLSFGLTLILAFILTKPLWDKSSTNDENSYNNNDDDSYKYQLYKSQLLKLKETYDNGEIDEGDYKINSTKISRKLLKIQKGINTKEPILEIENGKMIAIFLTILIGIFSIYFYLDLGRIGMPDHSLLLRRLVINQQQDSNKQQQVVTSKQNDNIVIPEDMEIPEDPAERQEMIMGMIDNLAEKLADEPKNWQGWARLVRSYKNLGENDKAKKALNQAKTIALTSGDIQGMLLIARSYREYHNMATPPEVSELLVEILSKSPNTIEALWFKGVELWQENKQDEGNKIFAKILEIIPKSTNEYNTLNKMISDFKQSN